MNPAHTRRHAGPSLRRTLLTWLIVPLLVLVPLAWAMIYGLAVRPALDGLDRALTDTAVALAELIVVRDGRPQLPLSEQTVRALRADLVDEVAFAVGDGRGGVLGGEPALLPLSPPVGAGRWAFFDSTLHGRAVRAAVHGVACGDDGRVCPIVVSESLGKRRDAERAVALAALGAASVLAVSLALLAWLAVQRGLRPLQQASADMAARSLDRLDAMDVASMPREVAPFVVALNDLFARLREAVGRQRAFIEDASHQLRTPLATLLSESTLALARPHPPELQPTLRRLHAAAERGARLAQQLLTLARADDAARSADAPTTPVDLAALAAEGADGWLHPSLSAGQDLGFDLEPAVVRGNDLLLRELLDNLVRNAIDHAGAGVRVTVRTRTAGGAAVLEVEDDGRGLSPEDLARVWERFRRGRDASGPGSGLGLAIVRDIARVHGGEASLRPGSAGRGLVVSVSIPAYAEPGAVRATPA